MVVATDVVNQEAVWFPDETPVEQALVASSAMPGVFPWQKMRVSGRDLTLVDGGAIANQPLSNLVEQGCARIYACAVGHTGPLPAPTNALENAMRSINLTMRQATKLEEDYVRVKLGPQGHVHHIHPIVDFDGSNFNFTPTLVRQVMEDARAKTVDWLSHLPPD